LLDINWQRYEEHGGKDLQSVANRLQAESSRVQGLALAAERSGLRCQARRMVII